MARNDLPQKYMADVTVALEDAHEAAIRAQSIELSRVDFEQLAELSIANARKAIQLAENALQARRKNLPDN